MKEEYPLFPVVVPAAAALQLFSAAVVADQFDVHAICLDARAYVRATPRYLLA